MRHHGGEVVLGEPGVEGVDADIELRAPRLAPHPRQEAGGDLAGLRLLGQRDGILEIEDQGVGPDLQALLLLAGESPGTNSSERIGSQASVVGRLRIIAWRRHSATRMPSWL